MFGLFKSKEEKAQTRLLQELEAGGAARSSDPVVRRRHAHLVHMLRSEAEALPLYEAIAADHPENKRALFTAGMLRLESGDPAGLAMLEEVAQTRPSLASPAYRMMVMFHHHGGNAEEARRLMDLGMAAQDVEAAALAEGRFIDPGSDVEPHRYSAEDLHFIKAGVGGAPGLEGLLAGSRLLDDGGFEHVLLLEADPRAEEAAMARVAEIISLYGDFLLYAEGPSTGWLRDRLEAVEGSRIYP